MEFSCCSGILAAEIIEMAPNAARRDKMLRINPKNLGLVIQEDRKLNLLQLNLLLSGGIISIRNNS